MGTRTASENMIKIDGDKLYSAMKERGLTPARICREVDVNSGYFSNAKYRNSMANMMIVLFRITLRHPERCLCSH